MNQSIPGSLLIQDKNPSDLTLKELVQEQTRLINTIRGRESEAMTARDYQRLNMIKNLLSTISEIKTL